MMHAHGGGFYTEFIFHQSLSLSYKSELIYIKPTVTQQTEAIQPIDKIRLLSHKFDSILAPNPLQQSVPLTTLY